jgi:hypothetical protein
MAISTLVRGKLWAVATISRRFLVEKTGKKYRVVEKFGTRKPMICTSMKAVKDCISNW